MRSAPRRRFNGVRSHLYPSYKAPKPSRSEEHTSELQSRLHLVCRLLLEKKKFKYDKLRLKHICSSNHLLAAIRVVCDRHRDGTSLYVVSVQWTIVAWLLEARVVVLLLCV